MFWPTVTFRRDVAMGSNEISFQFTSAYNSSDETGAVM